MLCFCPDSCALKLNWCIREQRTSDSERSKLGGGPALCRA